MRYRALLPFLLAPCLLFAETGFAQHHDHQHGEVGFPISCDAEAQAEFDIGLAQLHHMRYEQARPHFQSAAEADPQSAMAHWGSATTSFHPLWYPTPDEGLERGKAAVKGDFESIPKLCQRFGLTFPRGEPPQSNEKLEGMT